ncbi:hypothetical protein A2533_00445 [Candidatus Falkowbacteria bacterium RIFOXYD2_FULL_35_9]|uniref:Dipeptidylpeptidase IV N-terminal domain-containing protein n=1 Tax=Candidatus Falkowbacteria bacterium RIFOXYC2_FULL_36_12 TaxID=1798002 RepID=A0A1F5T063_9BACT|nr:MAG: hypothetical protein A2300_03125 [Candidatus Falkowbacteria bacterium RIFOXYB2_FULL_35_7]OGF32309.1 MAG: hypothetical protein A2478_03220 [Candidatus Falkowbacteria bacterium RIFOXYC2_FULL_36_12]OGF46640.1 MAG: hypothetical protein A2533_00445 [Candidatus Falkowbacteria bacterium RIFOXYD2_FULL_35_9]
MPNNLGREEKPLLPNEEIPQTSPSSSGTSTVLTIIIGLVALIIGAGGAGAGVYFWQGNQFSQEKSTLQSELQQAKDALALTEEQSTTNAELIKKLQENPPIADIKIETIQGNYDETKGGFPTSFTLKDGDTVIKQLEFPAETNNDGMFMGIFKQTADNVYFYTEPLGFGGLILYSGVGAHNLYKYNLRDKSFEQIFGMDTKGILEDLSVDEKLLTYRWEDNIFVLNLASKDVHKYLVPEKYNQYGDITFSPNGKNLVFAAVESSADNAKSAIYHIDLEKNTMDLFKEGENRVFYIKQFNSNNYNDIEFYYIPLNF